MSKKTNKKQPQTEPVETIQESLTKTEEFIIKNQKKLLYTIVGIIVVILLIVGYNKLIVKPKEQKAASEMFIAERNFERDSFNLALNGAEGYPGFLQIIEDYKGTKAANLAYFYAGVSYMYLNDYDNAIKYLKNFKTEDPILATEKYGAIGDAYVQKDNYQEAIKFYKKAVADDYSNDLTTPLFLKKLGLVYEKLGDYSQALKQYQKIYQEYPKSSEARTIEKYIERAKLNLK